MRLNEKRLFQEENDIKPNKYATVALLLCSLVYLVVLELNEMGFFLVSRVAMLLTSITAIVLMVGSVVGIYLLDAYAHPKTKYWLMTVVVTVTLITGMTVYVHTTLIAVLPLILATQYPSRKMGRFALVGSLLCAVASPALAYRFSLMDYGFYRYMLMAANIPGAAELSLTATPTWEGMLHVMQYISLPNGMMIAAMFPLISSVNKHAKDRLENQLQVLHMGESDALTDLRNRHSFMHAEMHFANMCMKNVVCVYVDVNGLHALNNTQGHEAGDRMLLAVAEAMKEQYGEEDTFRIGGDEFTALAGDISLEEVEARNATMRSKLEAMGYSISIGVESAGVPCSLKYVINGAEAKMQEDKRAYYRRINSVSDRGLPRK